MVDTQDAGTLTDVCISEQLPEVELISLVEESLPRYRLRADTITDFTDYKHQDWGVKQPPLIRAQDLQLTHLQIQEVFKYFLICGERVSQMTKVFDDIEAVTRLLEEKEKDLELAARIGQTLLEQNKSLVDKCEQLELDLISYQEQTAQLKHDLIQKETLLQLLTAEEQTDGRNPSPIKETSSSKYVELIQKKLSSMEEENSNLRYEISNLAEQTQQIEQHEQNLTKDCIQQLSDAQIRIRELQAEVDQKGVDLIKCQEECSRVIQQLVSGQQKLKELTIENLDMKETIKTSNEIQQELTSELFELREKYKECKDLLDSTKHEVDQLKLKSSPRVATNRYYSGPCYIPPEGSFAAELESLNSVDRDEQRKSNSKALETAQYVRKLSSRPPSMSSSMSSSSGRLPGVNKKGVNPLLVAPIPGSATRKAVASPLTTSMISGISTITNTPIKPPNAAASSSRPSGLFFDEIERHRQNLGRPGIPGSKDLDAALKRLSLRRQNEASEKEYELRERHISQQSTQSTDTVQSASKLPELNLEWSGTSTPTVRSPSPESELSGYGSASSFGYRMPEKLQIVKPMEGSATLHHWQRLATPHMAGIFEERDGVQIKHEQPLTDMESTTYSLLDVEEEVTPVRPMARTLSTYTVTDARVMHPSMTSFIPYTTPANSVINTSTVTSSSGNSRPTTLLKRAGATSTFSLSMGLASILSERGITAIGVNKNDTSATSPMRFGCLVTDSLDAFGARTRKSAGGFDSTPTTTTSSVASSASRISK